jgi:hypothetical protein
MYTDQLLMKERIQAFVKEAEQHDLASAVRVTKQPFTHTLVRVLRTITSLNRLAANRAVATFGREESRASA